MATQVQNRRGTTAEHSTFTGAVGELTVDTTKDTVVVHDGAVAGGRPLLREDQSNLPTSAPTTGLYNASGALALSTNGVQRINIEADGDINIDSGGVFYDATNNRFGIGTTSPSYSLDVNGAIRSDGTSGGLYFGGNSTTPSLGSAIHRPANDTLAFVTASTERARIDSDGRLLVGTSSSRAVGGVGAGDFQIEVSGSKRCATFVRNGGSPILSIGTTGATGIGDTTLVADGDLLGVIQFAGADGTDLETQGASIHAAVDGTPGANNMPGRLVFSTTSTTPGASPTERMRIDNEGEILIGKTTQDNTTGGVRISNLTSVTPTVILTNTEGADTTAILVVNRQTSDGRLVQFRQNNSVEGTISVSGTTVTYGGGHLARWSQLPNNEDPSNILKGTVMSNLDEMCEWGDEDNEQLNKTKVSDVEGDPNVAGVFVATSFDEEGPKDFFVAMTGDMVIRIAAGTTVQRGDLLMSAGDGTAKPQDDDTIRSKTIAKVTSTNVSCTYDDGSYCVPCVLMAC